MNMMPGAVAEQVMDGIDGAFQNACHISVERGWRSRLQA
jgi:hypothetical protein